jgi:hypothetical protein
MSRERQSGPRGDGSAQHDLSSDRFHVSTFKAPIAFILCSIAAPVRLLVHMTRPANQPAHSPQQPALLERILRRRTSALSSAARIVQTATDACHV